MCGIVGYSGVCKAGRREQFVAICRQSCIRGVHAFGIAYKTPTGIAVYKSLDLDDVLAHIPEPLPSRIVFHNRYSTSGDYKVIENNQPICRGGDCLVFNGTIDMGTKEEMESRYGIRLETDNDGELVLNDLLAGDPFKRLSDDKVTFAGIYLGEQGMFAFRNRMRPLWCSNVPGGRFITSTLDIVSRAKIGENNSQRIPAYKLFRL